MSKVTIRLNRAGVRQLAAVLPVHTHYDHALDSAVVAERTGATLVKKSANDNSDGVRTSASRLATNCSV